MLGSSPRPSIPAPPPPQGCEQYGSEATVPDGTPVGVTMATGPARDNRTLRGGLDLGGTKIQAVVITRTHRVVGEARVPTPVDGGPEAVAAATAGVATRYLAGVGVGLPGSVDARAGTVSQAGNLPGWDGSFPLGDRLSHLLGCTVRLGNDVQVANRAEMRLGAGRGHPSFIGVAWGTGVGGSVVLDGRLWVGRGAAGEAWRPIRDGPRWRRPPASAWTVARRPSSSGS